jgi:ribosomal protein L11 methyltransferase
MPATRAHRDSEPGCGTASNCCANASDFDTKATKVRKDCEVTVTASFALTPGQARLAVETLSEADETPFTAIDAHEVATDRWLVVAYFATADRRLRAGFERDAATAARAPVAIEWQTLADADWVARSQEALPPVRAGRVAVYGRHDRDRIRPNEIAIEIEAAQAFGTGHHATTQGCLLAIQAVARQRSITTALDVGTGTGVLAIALARLAVRVTATEIDAVSAAIARGNAVANGVASRIDVRMMPQMPRRLPLARHERHDLAVANILLGPLLTLAPAISQALKSGGVAILSGLVADQRPAVAARYRQVGLVVRRWFVRDGWLTMVLERPRHRAGSHVQALRMPAAVR